MELKCYIDLFNLYQTAYLPDGSTLKFELSNMPCNIIKYCLDENIPVIHLYGPSDFCDEFSNDVINYSKNKIRVEVN